jgi:hypothetical protein
MKLLVGLVASLCLGGCIGFHHSQARPVTPFPPTAWSPPPAAQAVPLAVSVTYSLSGDLLFEMARRAEEVRIAGAVTDVIDRSVYFRPSLPEAQPPYSLVIDVRVRREPNLFLAVLSGLTLCIFPYWATDEYTFWAVLRDRAGHPLGERRLSGSETVVMSLPLVLAMPFASPRSSIDRLYAEIAEELAAWAHDLVLGASGPPASVARAAPMRKEGPLRDPNRLGPST